MPEYFPSDQPQTDFEKRMSEINGAINDADAIVKQELEGQGRFGTIILSAIKNWIAACFEKVWATWVKWFGWIFKSAVELLDSIASQASPAHYRKWLDGFIENGWIDNDDAKALYSIVTSAGVMGKTAQIFLTVLLTQKIVSAFTDVVGATAV